MLAPPLLVKSFEGGSGLRKDVDQGSEDIQSIELSFPSPDITEFLMGRFIRALQNEEFFVHHLHTDLPTYQVRKDDIMFILVGDGTTFQINVPAEHQHIARLMLVEELLALSDLRKRDTIQI